ncbi:MAG: hypothetical protein PVF26_08505 [Desulfobacterales bacterium]|jgi:hypothetical protein
MQNASSSKTSVIWQRARKYVFNQLALAQDFQKGALHLTEQIGVKQVGNLYPERVRDALASIRV